MTDIHEVGELELVTLVADVLQTPAFLCRQTNFISSVAASGKPVNLKKGQFLSPGEMINVVDKAVRAARDAGVEEDNFMVCERGTSFGYNNLVSDMRSLEIMRRTNARSFLMLRTRFSYLVGEVIIGWAEGVCTHSCSGSGCRWYSRCFYGNTPNPDKALSDGPNAVPLAMVENLLEELCEIDRIVKKCVLRPRYFKW